MAMRHYDISELEDPTHPALPLRLIAGETFRPAFDSTRRAHQKRRLTHYRLLAQKVGHYFALWSWSDRGRAATECHECGLTLAVDFSQDRSSELVDSTAIDQPCMVLPPRR